MKITSVIIPVILVLLAATAVWFGRDFYIGARMGVTYVAKQTCSCLFVAKRDLQSCKTDYEAADIESLTWHIDGDRVRISALAGLLSASALYEEGFGCHPID